MPDFKLRPAADASSLALYSSRANRTTEVGQQVEHMVLLVNLLDNPPLRRPPPNPTAAPASSGAGSDVIDRSGITCFFAFRQLLSPQEVLFAVQQAALTLAIPSTAKTS